MNQEEDNVSPMPLMELAFRSTLQLQIRYPESNPRITKDGMPIIETKDIWGYGSGFLIEYNGRFFLITADHNIHPEDHDANNPTGQRNRRDYQIDVITNVPGPDISSIVLPIGGFLHFTGIGFGDDFNPYNENAKEILINVLEGISKGNIDINDDTIPIDCRIHDIIDIAISKLTYPLKAPLLSNQVELADKNIVVRQGAPKVVLKPRCGVKLMDKTQCVVAGTVLNELKNGETQLKRVNAMYEIGYDNKQSDSHHLFFRCDSPFDIQKWAGLSGAPVLREDGLLVGMLVNGPGETGLVTVIPIDKILKGIDYQIRVESIGI